MKERLIVEEMLRTELGLSELPKHKLIMKWYDIALLMQKFAAQEVEAEIEKRIPNEEEIENGINTLAQLHALKSVGDWATGYITGAKWFRNRMKGNNK